MNGVDPNDLEMNSSEISSVAGERNRGPKASVTQTQRYTSEDLYKPRPVIGRSRRSRALDGISEADSAR